MYITVDVYREIMYVDSDDAYPEELLTPLLPNPGGIIDPQHLVDRVGELEALLAGAMSNGAYVIGDRRMGKTSLLRKAAQHLRESGHLVVHTSAERSTLAHFEAELYAALREQTALRTWLRGWDKELAGSATLKIRGSGLTVSGKVARTGETVERDLLRICSEAARKNRRRLVLIIDEIAVLANRLHEQDARSADDFLRSLRAARQTHDNIAIVLSGSVGLHHALDDLTSLNDLREVPIGPLAQPDATFLARQLLLGIYDRDDEQTRRLAVVVAEQCGGVPYYIHRVLSDYQGAGGEMPTSAAFRERMDLALVNNDLATDHYLTRLGGYYGDDADVVITLLDHLAIAERTLPLDALVTALTAAGFERERGDVGSLLRRMMWDHYVLSTTDGYRFVSDFMHRVWRSLRSVR